MVNDIKSNQKNFMIDIDGKLEECILNHLNIFMHCEYCCKTPLETMFTDKIKSLNIQVLARVFEYKVDLIFCYWYTQTPLDL